MMITKEEVTTVTRFVKGVLRRKGIHTNFWLEDFIQEGLFAFVLAKRKFDPSRGSFKMFWMFSVESSIMETRRNLFGRFNTEKGRIKMKASHIGLQFIEDEVGEDGLEERYIKHDTVVRAFRTLNESEQQFMYEMFFKGKRKPKGLSGKKVTSANAWFWKNKCFDKMRRVCNG